MSVLNKNPINLELIAIKDSELTKLKLVTELQIFDNTNNFHNEGLFSTSIFGNIGLELRSRTFGFIDLKTEILHPLVYYAIITLTSFYKQIMAGTTNAIWDNKTKSFVKSNDPEAQTGYSFFFSHISELVFQKNESEKRSFLIDFFNKAVKEDKYKARYILVLPAGVRDYIVDENGKPQEDEINSFYRKLLSQSSVIDPSVAKKTPEIYDRTRNNLQIVSLDIFEYIKSLLDGKHKLILGKWLTRKIFNSTRNVLSNPIEKINNINDPNKIGFNDTYIGLHQFLRTIAPKTLYEIKTKYLRNIFMENSNFGYLTNVKTLTKEEVSNSHIQKDYDLWTSSEGIEKTIANFGNLDIRHLPITLNKNKHYLGLLYIDNKYFKFFQDINSLPQGFNKENVSPITYAEFLYMSVYQLSGKYPALITRYPITGYGSITPLMLKIKTTTTSKILEELDDNWEPSGNIAPSFPVRDKDFFNTIAINVNRYAAAGADVDGDALSIIGLTTDEAIEEVKSQLKKRDYYISSDNRFYFSVETDTLRTVLAYMTA